jgi:hypothetical protein
MATFGAQLAFGFITPLFAGAGLLLAGIPILIHILNRRRYKIVTWAAMDFLLNAMKKNRRRLKFEQWALMAVRCLVLALLGLALARPLGCENASLAGLGASRAGVHVFVIDNSYSMAYEIDRPGANTHLAQAKLLAKGMIDRLSRGGESVAIVTASSPAAAIGNGKPTYDLDAAKAAIDRIEQSAGGTDVLGAMQIALQIGRDESKQPERTLYFLTDCTKSAWETQQAAAFKQTAAELAQVFKLTNFNLGRGQQTNQAAVELSPGSNLITTKFPADFRAVLRSFGGTPETPLQWKIDDQLQPGGGMIKLDASTPPQTLSNVNIKVGGPHVITASLAGGDKLKIDDTRYLVTAVASELKVLIVEGERGMGGAGGSGAFLQLALSPPKTSDSPAANGNFKTDSYFSAESISALELAGKVLTEYGAVAMTDVGQITASQADRLADYVKNGGTLVWFMGEQVSSENYNTILVPRKLLPGPLAKRMSVASDQSGFLFDFKPLAPSIHRLVSIFAKRERTGLETAQVFTYWETVLPDNSQVERVLDYLPLGSKPGATTEKDKAAADPAITTHTLGRGHVVFFSTSAGPEWTSLPAKPAYLALMHELLGGSISSGDAWLNHTVGQAVEVPISVQINGQPTLLDQNGKPVVLSPGAVGSAVAFRSEPLTRPGLYTFNSGLRTFPIAVNVPSDEADVRTMDNNAIKSALGGVDVDLQQDQLPPEGVVAQAGNDFGWTVMMIVLCFVGLECFLAMQFGHTRRAVVKA